MSEIRTLIVDDSSVMRKIVERALQQAGLDSLVVHEAASGAEGLENVVTLSTLRHTDFLADYGVAIASGPMTGLAARAVVVLDENNNVTYSQLVPEIANEPDYDAAISALA